MPTINDLRQRQALPLRAKVLMSQNRIREWYEHFDGNVCVSFSGGKDSTVLAHLVHDLYPSVPLVFSNTGLEYPEIQSFARKMGAEFVRPAMRFDEVVSKYGYPLISKAVSRAIYFARIIRHKKIEMKNGSKRILLLGKSDTTMFNYERWLPLCNETQFMISAHCCEHMKEKPLKNYYKRAGLAPIVGTLTEESKARETGWLITGCNAFDARVQMSKPLSFWLEQDILQYIKENNIEIASVYGDIVSVDSFGYEYEPLPFVDCTLKCSGCQRTGCIFCGFGAHRDKGESRFQMLARTHPRQYEYCMKGGQWVDNPRFDPAAPKYDGDWLNWNPRKIWVPSKDGLGMKKVFDDCNAIYGKDFIRYE